MGLLQNEAISSSSGIKNSSQEKAGEELKGQENISIKRQNCYITQGLKKRIEKLNSFDPEEQLKDQGDRETAAEEARVASAPDVAVASASDAAFQGYDRFDRLD